MTYAAYIQELKNRRKKKKNIKAGTRSTDAAEFASSSSESPRGGFGPGWHTGGGETGPMGGS